MKTFKEVIRENLITENTHKWYSVQGWKDGSKHNDTLDNLVGDNYRHAANADSSHPDSKRPDHHIGIPISNYKAIRFMDRTATSVK